MTAKTPAPIPAPKQRFGRFLLYSLGGVLLLQAVPYGREHYNPPISKEPVWDSPQTRDLAKRACFDCHSNETQWPWYSHLAPVSWLVQNHVDEARSEVNFSDWRGDAKHGEKPGELQEMIEEGEMPMAGYVAIHGHAKLSEEEKKQLAAGLVATAKANGPSANAGIPPNPNSGAAVPSDAGPVQGN
jgi:hypothetical protein